MARKKGRFIGGYIDPDLYETVKRRASAEHRTVSAELERILTEAVQGKSLPLGAHERRQPFTLRPNSAEAVQGLISDLRETITKFEKQEMSE